MRIFEEFIKTGYVKKQRKNISRARSLVEEAEKRIRFVKSLEHIEDNANYIIENIYDVIRELIEAKLSLEGYKSYSHEATVNYLEKLSFSEHEIRFIDELRKIRHGIKYYGRSQNMDYAKSVIDFLEKILGRLMRYAREA